MRITLQRKAEIDIVGVVPGYIHRYLMLLEINVGFRQPKISAILMTMPEITIDKNDSLIFSKDNIRESRQLPVVDAIAQTAREKILTCDNLWLRIFSLNRHHTATSQLCWPGSQNFSSIWTICGKYFISLRITMY